jgi:hypothetical protein
MAPWGPAPAEWLAAVLDVAAGIPSHETWGRVWAGLQPARLQQALAAWRKALTARHQALVARDGHPLRRSLDSAEGHGPMPGVQAGAAAQEVGLAPGPGDAHPPEMTARPAWLRRLQRTGAVVPLEALGWQVASARQMQAHGAASVLR